MKQKEFELYNAPKINSIQEMVIRSADSYKENLALKDINDTLISSVTFSQIYEFTLRFGESLRELGLNERSHIAIISENRVQWSLAYLTCMANNFVAVPIDKNLKANEIINIIYESDSEAIIYSDNFSELMEDHRSTLKKLKFFINMDLTARNENVYSMKELFDKMDRKDIKLPAINPNEPAALVFTSGSLGRAKGVMLSQKNLAANLFGMVSMVWISPEDRFLSVLPIHHTYECTCGMLCPVYSGASVYYSRSLKTVVEDLQFSKATVLLGVPLLYDKMFKRIYKAIKDDKVKSILVPALVGATNMLESIGWKSLKKKIFKEIHNRFGGSVRMFIAGGAAADPVVSKGLQEFGFTFIQGYGLTETSPILALNRLDKFKDDAAGLSLPNVELRIDNPDPEGNGEIWARGDCVMQGYYKNEEFTKNAFSGDWFKTGDIGFIDEDGFLHINGRKKNVIVSKGGKNIFPEEIEDILNRSPFILESIVYGEKDQKGDERIAAQIVVDADFLIEYSQNKNEKITSELMVKLVDEEIKKLNKELPSFKQITKFYIREQEFEKTTTQKIKRYLIKVEHNNE